MREAVRNGRRANFYITENSFIDDYARDVGTTGVAVYHVLERHANCETRSTWIGTAKMARLLNLDQRTIQRTIKKLESLRLIRIVRSENMTTFFIVPVPPRAKQTSAPLFDEISEATPDQGDTDVASATSLPWPATVMSPDTTSRSQEATSLSRSSDMRDAPNKEEQNLSNKTQEQNLPNKIFKEKKSEIDQAAQRIINILGLPAALLSAAGAAVALKVRGTKLSMDGVVQDLVTAANHAERRGVEKREFLEDFLAQTSAQRILANLDLPATNNLVSTVTAVVKAEATYRGFPVEAVAGLITSAALEDRRRGIAIDRFYFENVKWRNGNAGHKPSASQQRSERTKQNILDGFAAEISRRTKSDGHQQ